MKAVTLSLLFVLSVLGIGALNIAYEGFYRKANHRSEAIFKIPDSSIEITLERRQIHLFLAEYERNLLLRNGTLELLRREIADDTGGYGRLSVYQVSPTEYFLSGDLSFDRYLLDVSKVSIDEAIGSNKPKEAKFMGSFDQDENRKWRFIPAIERAEQKSRI